MRALATLEELPERWAEGSVTVMTSVKRRKDVREQGVISCDRCISLVN